MANIRVLDPMVAELIAAGEVVERPASIVKELVENSIDAGATQITVDIKGGGIGYIRITDNGHGINPDEVPLAFLRHATSKVSTAEDLDSITTLGFRGEALASIAAVSKVEITTKTAEGLDGVTYLIQGEVFDGPHPSGVPVGTTLIIRDVFYNIPARMKFLRRDITEGNAVAQAVDKCALSYPEIAFTFIRDSETKLRTSGNGDLRAVVAAIYDRDFAASMLSVDYQLENGIRVTGLIGPPSESKPSRSYQNFFVNRRYVRTRTGGVALEQAYKGKIMTGRFPTCILNIEIDASQIDPNVHPAKIEVRFTQEKEIFNAVYYAVKSALMAIESPFRNSFNEESTKSQSEAFAQTVPVEAADQQRLDYISSKENNESNDKLPFTPRESELDKQINFSSSAKTMDISVQKGYTSIDRESSSTDTVQLFPAEDSIIKSRESLSDTDNIISSKEYSDTGSTPINMRFIGELLDTYILLEQEGKLLVVDKHAAHERILYEEIRTAAAQQADRQVLLSPIPVTLLRKEYAVLLENLSLTESLGFLVEDFGTGTLIVRETPILLDGQDISFLLSEIAQKLLQQQTDLTPAALEQLYDSIACKTALRAGDKNNFYELSEIIRLLALNPHLTHCPHGRPIFLTISRQEIEKMFGRLG